MVSGGGGENAFQIFYISICTPGSGLTRKKGRPQMAGCLKRHRLLAPSDTLQRPKPINVRTAASWSLKAWSLPAISSGPRRCWKDMCMMGRGARISHGPQGWHLGEAG